jgi:hypothetical protein
VTTTIAGLGLAALAAVLYSLGTSDGERFTRRAWARIVLLGASGLSFLPGCLTRKRNDGRDVTVTCYAPLPPDDPPPSSSLLAKWARLGKVWREMSGHLKREPFDPEGEAEFKELETEMEAALDALPAWPELRGVVEQRWAHIHRRQYVAATCYEMMMGGPPPARGAVEEQVKELEQLVAEGKLTKEAAGKAAETLGVQAEYYVRLDEAEKRAGDDGPWGAWDELWKQYEAGEIVPGAPAELAGQRLAELTVDDLGLLGGQPAENEGLPDEEQEEQEADPDEEG